MGSGSTDAIPNRLIADGGWIERDGVTCLNLYRPPTIVPGDATAAQPWIDHVHKVLREQDADHSIKWFAHRVQKPEIKINHALVVGSDDHGVGKDTIFEPVRRAVGPWNFSEVSPQKLLGRIQRVSEVRHHAGQRGA